jgi:hypothetical protein
MTLDIEIQNFKIWHAYKHEITHHLRTQEPNILLNCFSLLAFHTN